MLFSNGWGYGYHRLGSSDSLEALNLLNDFSKIVHFYEFCIDYNIKLPGYCVRHFDALDFLGCIGDFPEFAWFRVD